jgi:hypothetical protein
MHKEVRRPVGLAANVVFAVLNTFKDHLGKIGRCIRVLVMGAGDRRSDLGLLVRCQGKIG